MSRYISRPIEAEQLQDYGGTQWYTLDLECLGDGLLLNTEMLTGQFVPLDDLKEQIREIIVDAAEDYAAIQFEWFNNGPNSREAWQDIHDKDVKDYFDQVMKKIMAVLGDKGEQQ